MKTIGKIINRFFLGMFLAWVGLSTPVWAQHWTADNGWAFHNFTTPEFSWELYRDTFIGIPPTRDPAASGFDVLFYDYVYKSELSANGNCYGMSLMAQLILEKGGHLGYCAPCAQYSGDLSAADAGPTDPNLYHAINQMHGHQVNLPSLKQYLEIIALGKNRDGLYAFDQAGYYALRNDPVLVSITKGLSPVDGGHTLAVINAVSYGANDKRIYLYDPNRSWYDPADQPWYINGENYIQIHSDHSWEFEMAGGEVWSGDPSSGGNIIITPVSLAGPRSRTPSSMGLNALTFINEFFIFGSGSDLEQVTNSQGKRLFKPGTKEIDNDPSTGLLNIVPFYPSDQGAPYDFSIFYQLDNPGGELDVQIRSRGGYRVDIAGMLSHLRVESIGGEGTDLFRIRDIGTASPALTLFNNTQAESLNATFTQIVKPGQEARVFKLTGLQSQAGSPVELKIIRNQGALEINNEKSSLGYNLEIERHLIGGVIDTVRLPAVQLDPGNIQIISPPSWKILKLDPNIFFKDFIRPPVLFPTPPIGDLLLNVPGNESQDSVDRKPAGS